MLAGFNSCRPQDGDDHSLGAEPQASQLAFTATGKSAEGTTVQGEYPYAGTYAVTMTLFTSGGSATVTQNINIAEDDATLLDSPWYNALTGGASAVEGKTWVFDQYHDNHFGVDDVNAYPRSSGWWWDCPAEGKEGSSLYDQEFTFVLDGTKLIWKNRGFIYTNENGMNALGHGGAENPVVGDYDCPYIPADGLTFSIDESAKTLTLGGDEALSDKSGSWANPAPVPINESDKVFLYQKKAGEKYSNVSFVEPAEHTKFDLTKGR